MNDNQKNVKLMVDMWIANNLNKIRWTMIILFIFAIFICSFNSCSYSTQINNEISSEIWDIAEDENVTDILKTDYEKIQQDLNQKVEEGLINISMNSNPVFEDGSAKGNLMITNNKINKYYQIVEIYLDDTGERIYQSGTIPVGKQIANDHLDINLNSGVYNCTAYFNAVRKNGEYVGKAGAKIKITILN